MDHEANSAIIVAKLASFGIPTRVVGVSAGPVVTQYELEPDPSVRVSRIEALSDDLAMALSARSIRIEAPIPGRSVVGIEIPNAMDLRVVKCDPGVRGDTVSGAKVMTNILLGIQLFLGIIGGLTLMIGGVGVANIMYATVKERTREIGVKMALGARPR